MPTPPHYFVAEEEVLHEVLPNPHDSALLQKRLRAAAENVKDETSCVQGTGVLERIAMHNYYLAQA